MSIEFAQVIERGRALAAQAKTIDRRWLLMGAAVLAFVVVIPLIWLLFASGEKSEQTVAAESLRMTVICGACGMRDSIALGTIRSLPVGNNGLMVCPKCGQPELDRYRRGAPGILHVDVQDETPSQAP
jgi:hypothetical protein